MHDYFGPHVIHVPDGLVDDLALVWNLVLPVAQARNAVVQVVLREVDSGRLGLWRQRGAKHTFKLGRPGLVNGRPILGREELGPGLKMGTAERISQRVDLRRRLAAISWEGNGVVGPASRGFMVNVVQ